MLNFTINVDKLGAKSDGIKNLKPAFDKARKDC